MIDQRLRHHSRMTLVKSHVSGINDNVNDNESDRFENLYSPQYGRGKKQTNINKHTYINIIG